MNLPRLLTVAGVVFFGWATATAFAPEIDAVVARAPWDDAKKMPPPAAPADGEAAAAAPSLPPIMRTGDWAIALPAAGYYGRLDTMTVEPQGYINPPTFDRTFRITDRGVQPSAKAKDTTYVACHTNARKSVASVPCNALPDAVDEGDDVYITKGETTLRYTVTQAKRVRRAEFEHDQEVWGVHPGRLVWVTCYIADRRRTDFNYVVIAEIQR